MTATTRLYEIVGEPMSAVSFVYDYVELHFDGKILRALPPVSVVSERGRFVVPEPGSRDALCELLGRSVINIAVCNEDSIKVEFSDNSLVIIPLSENYRSSPEAAHYVPGDRQPMEVW